MVEIEAVSVSRLRKKSRKEKGREEKGAHFIVLQCVCFLDRVIK